MKTVMANPPKKAGKLLFILSEEGFSVVKFILAGTILPHRVKKHDNPDRRQYAVADRQEN